MTRAWYGVVAVALSISAFGCGAEPCTDLLDAVIDQDLTIGDCRLVERTDVRDGARLTVEPGTRVEFATDGYLSVNADQSGAALVAEASSGEEMISFTASKLAAEPGEWQCVWIGKGSADTSLVGAEFEFGGTPCEARGNRPEGMLVLNSEIRRIDRTDFRLSASHGLVFEQDGRVEERVTNSRFNDIETDALPSVRMGLNAVLSMGAGNFFSSSEDYIAVDTIPPLTESGDWLPQPVPYRLLRDERPGAGSDLDANINTSASGPVVVKPGTVIQLDNGSIEVLLSTFRVEGSESNPVKFTSAEETPSPGDWGCLKIVASPDEAPSSIDHAVFEYGGSGIHCTGNRHKGAIYTDKLTPIDNTTFRNLLVPEDEAEAAASIITAVTCPEGSLPPVVWCDADNVFADGLDDIACGTDEERNCGR